MEIEVSFYSGRFKIEPQPSAVLIRQYKGGCAPLLLRISFPNISGPPRHGSEKNSDVADVRLYKFSYGHG